MPSKIDAVKLAAGFDKSRLAWEKIKKEAAGHGVNTAVFKGGLGPAMDDYAKLYRAVEKARKPGEVYPKPQVQKLRAQQQKIDKIVRQYKTACQEEAKKTNVAAARAQWKRLFEVLTDLNENRDALVDHMEQYRPPVKAADTKYV